MTEVSSPVEKVESHIAGKSLAYYWRTVRWFVLVLVILEIVDVVVIEISYGRWIIAALMGVVLTWWMAKRGRVSMMTAVIAAAGMGMLAGFGLAVFDIIWYHKWWYVLNVIRMPFILGVIGMATGFACYVLFRNFITKREKTDTKGGGIYGRSKTS